MSAVGILASYLAVAGFAGESPPAGRDVATAGSAEQPVEKAGPRADIHRQDAEIARLESAVAKTPGDAEAHYQLALALRRARRRPESVAHFERAVTIGPATPARLLDLGVAYSDVSRYDEAESTYARLLALTPDDGGVILNLANVAVRRGNFDRGVELYRKVLAIDPQDLDAQYHLAQTLKFAGKRDEAYAGYESVMKLSPANPRQQMARIDALYEIASIDLARGESARAEQRFLEVIHALPDHHAAHWGRAQALLRLGRQAEAKQEIDTHARILAARLPTGPSVTAP